MGVFKRDNLNIVQQQMLFAVNHRKNKEKYDLEESRFEQQMMIVNPDMYKDYMQHKRDNADGPALVPQTADEVKEIQKIFDEINKNISKQDLAYQPDGMSQDTFNGINISEIGGD